MHRGAVEVPWPGRWPVVGAGSTGDIPDHQGDIDGWNSWLKPKKKCGGKQQLLYWSGFAGELFDWTEQNRKMVSFFSKNEPWRSPNGQLSMVFFCLSLVDTHIKIGMEQKVCGSESSTQEAADFVSSSGRA